MYWKLASELDVDLGLQSVSVSCADLFKKNYLTSRGSVFSYVGKITKLPLNKDENEHHFNEQNLVVWYKLQIV